MSLVLRVCIRKIRSPRWLLPLLIAVAALPPAATAQTTVTLSTPGTQVNADTTIRGGGYAGVNYSTSAILESKVSGDSSNTRRILLKFDTQNLIPAGSTINSAKLSLVLKEAADSTSRPIGAYRVTQSFSGPEVNWLDKQYGNRWATQGGDLGDKFATTNVGNSVGSTYTFDLTQLVQRAVKGEFGSRYTRVALLDTGGASGGSYRSFHSSRASNTSQRPRLVITYGASATSASSTTSGTSTTTGSSTTLKVMQWNIHKTMGSDGGCNASRTADWIARLGAQVVSLNEVSYYSGSCSYTADQGATLQSLLQSKTGKTWYRKFVNGMGGSSGLGNLILSRYQFSSSSTYLLSYQRGVVQVGIVVNGRNVNVFSTHVDYDNSSNRTTQIKQAKAWAGNFAQPRIIMGDFNTSPGTGDYNLMASSDYYDAWARGQKYGVASSYNGSGATHGSSRFDYVFFRGTPLSLKSVNVPDTRSSGVYPSDHNPVVVEFTVQ
jgi:endonuclease/exonuclease/phosphatase family metal-dependent hydrolase